MSKEKTIEERLRIMANMISLGEKISWGSDSAIMREAADELEKRDRIAREEEGERVCDIYEEALANNYGETLWSDDESNEIMRQSLDAFIDAVDREVTKNLTTYNDKDV